MNKKALVAFLLNKDRFWEFKDITLEKALDIIKSTRYKSRVEKLQNAGSEEAKEYKMSFPAIAFSGTFNKEVVNEDFKCSSGIFLVDIDKIGSAKEVDKTKKMLTEIPYTVFAFTSPSSTGLKAGFNIAKQVKNDQDHKNVFNQIKDLLASSGIVLDEACKDIRRLCFCSYDPNIFTNWNAEVFKLNPDFVRKVPSIEITRHSIKYTIEQYKDLLSKVPADDRKTWLDCGIILGREFNCGDEAWELYNEWSNTWEGDRDKNDPKRMHDAFYIMSQKEHPNPVTVGSLIHIAKANGWEGWGNSKIRTPIDQYLYSRPGNNYIYLITGDTHIKEAVDSACEWVHCEWAKTEDKRIKPSAWLKRNRFVSSHACDPSLKESYVPGLDYTDDGPIEIETSAIYNSYKASNLILGNSKLAKPWLDHAYKLLNKPGDAEHVLDYLACIVQKPEVKIRHGVVLGGTFGNGKDTTIEMVEPAVGRQNCGSISPSQVMDSFNEFYTKTLLRINEVSDLHDINKIKFYEASKNLLAGNPDTKEINKKYGVKYNAKIHGGIFLTTNHLDENLYMPRGDRRYYVCETATLEEMGFKNAEAVSEYFKWLWSWYVNENGANHIAAFLHERDISEFNPNQTPRVTDIHEKLIEAGDWYNAAVLEAIADLDFDEIVVLHVVVDHLADSLGKNCSKIILAKNIGTVLQKSGYVKCISPNNANRGRFKIKGRYYTAFAKKGISNQRVTRYLESISSKF